jgi:FixJ family two-component response regulator
MGMQTKIRRAVPARAAQKSQKVLSDSGCGLVARISACERKVFSELIEGRARLGHEMRQKLQTLILLEGMLTEIVQEGRAQKLVSLLETATKDMSDWVALHFAERNIDFTGPLHDSALEELSSIRASQNLESCADAIHLSHPEALPSTVFIVDDDRAVRETICEVLRVNGYSTEDFADGSAFLKAHSINRTGCLLVDACMPAMDGFQLIERLDGSPGVLRAIMMTAHGDVKMAVRAMKVGALDFLEKPFSQDELLASIERALRAAPNQGALLQRRLSAQTQISQLTGRQRQVLDHVLSGQSSKNIATVLSISQRTVDNHRAAIMRKMGARSLPALLRVAVTATCG